MLATGFAAANGTSRSGRSQRGRCADPSASRGEPGHAATIGAMPQIVRVGVAGAGHWATMAHMPAVQAHPGATLVAVADTDPARVERARASFDVPFGFGNPLEMIATCELDAVIVASPHATHFEIAMAAIERGLNVLVEKPLVLVPEHGRKMVEAAERAGAEIVVGYTWHYNEQALIARDWIASGRLGTINYVQSFFGSSPVNLYRGNPEADPYAYGSGEAFFGPQPATYSDPRLAGGGQGQTQLTHSLALLMFLTGLEPLRVSAFMDRLDARIDVIDTLAIRFRGGGLGAVGSTGAVVPTDHTDTLEYRIYGSAGHLQFDVDLGALRLFTNDGAQTAEVIPPEERYPMYRPARNLIDLTLGTASNGSPVSIAQQTVELLDAAYRSAVTGGQPVDLRGGKEG
jgi:predicted dehydrogenase